MLPLRGHDESVVSNSVCFDEEVISKSADAHEPRPRITVSLCRVFRTLGLLPALVSGGGRRAFLLGLESKMSATFYTTELTKNECLLRLQQHTGRGGWVRWAEGTMVAKIHGDRFRLFAWGPANVRNSFATFYYGRLEAGADGTSIRGRFRFHPVVRGFLILWFGGLLAIGALILLLPPSAWGAGQPPSLFAALGPAGMILLGVAFVRLCRWVARGQEKSMRCFLERELRAQLHVEGRPNRTRQSAAATPHR